MPWKGNHFHLEKIANGSAASEAGVKRFPVHMLDQPERRVASHVEEDAVFLPKKDTASLSPFFYDCSGMHRFLSLSLSLLSSLSKNVSICSTADQPNELLRRGANKTGLAF